MNGRWSALAIGAEPAPQPEKPTGIGTWIGRIVVGAGIVYGVKKLVFDPTKDWRLDRPLKLGRK